MTGSSNSPETPSNKEPSSSAADGDPRTMRLQHPEVDGGGTQDNTPPTPPMHHKQDSGTENAPEFGPTIPHLPLHEGAGTDEGSTDSVDSLYLDAILEYEKARDSGVPFSISDWIEKWAERRADLRDRLADYLNKAGLLASLDFYPYSHFRYLGHGGMGVVFRVHDERLGRDAAIKIPLPGKSASSAASSAAHFAETASDRLREEARIMSRIEHPNVVSVYDMGRLPGRIEGRTEADDLFYTMKLVEGNATLYDAIQATKSLPEPERRVELLRHLQYIVLVCRAVGFAHSKFVVHRDIKPKNIAVGDYGQVFVLDWGLACDLTEFQSCEGSEAAWATATFCGSPGWVAPEVAARARPQSERDTDTQKSPFQGMSPFERERQADIYGLGATLYYVILGVSPYSAKNVEEWFQLIAARDPVSPSRKDRSVPRPLDAICNKALARNPRERYQSAGQLADDIERFLADEPVTAYRENARERLARWARKHRGLVWAGVIAVLTVVSILTGYQQMRQHQLHLKSEKLFAEREARTRKYHQLLSQTAIRSQQLSVGWIEENLRDLAESSKLDTAARDPADLRSRIAVCLAGVDTRREDVTLSEFHASAIDLLPNGRQLAIGRSIGGLVRHPRVDLIDIQTRLPVTSMEVKNFSFLFDSKGRGLDDVAVSPDGRFVFGIARQGTLYRWDLSKSPATMQSIEVPTGKGRIKISPDGRWLAAWSVMPPKGQASSLAIVSVDEFAVVTRRTYQELLIEDEATAAGFSPDSKKLVFSTGKGLQLRDVPSLSTTIWHTTDQGIPLCLERDVLSIRPDCFELRSLETDATVKLYSPLVGVEIRGEDQRALAVTPDNSLVLLASQARNRLLGWDTAGFRLVVNQPLTQTGQGIRLCVTPNGNKIAIASSRGVEFLDLLSDDVHRMVAPADSPILSMTTSSDGRWLATLPESDPGQVSLWQLDEKGAATHTASWMSAVQFAQGKPCIAFSHNGHELIHSAGNRVGEQPAYSVMRRFSLPEATELPSHSIVSENAAHRDFAIHTHSLGFGSNHVLYASSHRHLLAWNMRSSPPQDVSPPAPDIVATADLLKMGRSMVGLAIGKSLVAQCSEGFANNVQRQLVVACRISTQVGTASRSDQMSLLVVDAGASCCEFSSDENLLLVGLADGTIAVVSSPAPRLLRQVRAHNDRITAIRMYSNSVVATASTDRTIGLWRLSGDQLTLLCRLPATGDVTSMSLIPGKGLLFAHIRGEFRVHCWNIEELAERFENYGLGFSLRP